jgi:hypothetical protein
MAMLSVSASRLVVNGARRAVVVAGQRRGAVEVVRRTSVRGIQSIAQTDRVSIPTFCVLTFYHFTYWIGYHYPFIVLYWYQARGRTSSSDLLVLFAPFPTCEICSY